MTTLAAIDPGVVVFIGVAAFFAIVFIIYEKRRERERRDRLRTWATAKGFSFDHHEDKRFDDPRRHFHALNQGQSRAAFNTIRADLPAAAAPTPFRAGDFKFTIQAGKSSVTHRISYLLITLPFPRLPTTRLRRENISDKLGAAIGLDDIDFEDAEFSARFHVSSADKRFAYDLLDPNMIEFLKAALADRPWSVELAAGELFIASVSGLSTNVWETYDFERALALAAGILERWPEHLAARLRA